MRRTCIACSDVASHCDILNIIRYLENSYCKDIIGNCWCKDLWDVAGDKLDKMFVNNFGIDHMASFQPQKPQESASRSPPAFSLQSMRKKEPIRITSTDEKEGMQQNGRWCTISGSANWSQGRHNAIIWGAAGSSVQMLPTPISPRFAGELEGIKFKAKNEQPLTADWQGSS